jgi:Family of unknown function (DUF5829)
MHRTLLALILAAMVALLGAAVSSGPLPFPVSLNHFYFVPDAATYQAISGSEFLKSEFAVTETRTTVRADSTYTGFYVYGVNTYFEFLETISSGSIAKGASGVAFGVDKPGGLKAIAAAMPEEFPGEATLITRALNDRPVPWFYMATPKSFPYGDPSGFSFWLMEYHSNFLAEWKPRPQGSNKGVARRDILGRYAATLTGQPAQPLFQDVVGLTVALEEARIKRWSELCRAFGFRLGNEKGATVLEGPDLILRLVPARSGWRGVREILMRLRRPPANPGEHKLGTSVLTLRDDATATWSF